MALTGSDLLWWLEKANQIIERANSDG